MKDLEDALFLRMFEILSGYSPFLFDEGQRQKMAEAWHEISPSVEMIADRIKE